MATRLSISRIAWVILFSAIVLPAFSQLSYPVFVNTGNPVQDSLSYNAALQVYDNQKSQLVSATRSTGEKKQLKKEQGSALDLMSAAVSSRTAAESCIIPTDATWSYLPGNDDGSSSLIPLPFTFDFYGTPFTGLYVNNNGNITFGNSYYGYSPSGFPVSGLQMISGFWDDIDTRSCGTVRWKVFNNTRIVISFENVGQYYVNCSGLNTFQIVIGTTNDPFLGVGQNVKLLYGDMQWTKGQSTVGINKGDGSAYVQVGRFGIQGSTAYDGGGGAIDGLDYLDYQCFSFNVSQAGNIPPSFSGLPTNNIINLTCGQTANFTIQSLPPEVNQTVSTTVNTNGLCGVTSTVTNGAVSTTNLSITGSACNIGTHTITLTSTDNGFPVQSTTVTLTVVVSQQTPVVTASGPRSFCQGGSVLLTSTSGGSYQWYRNGSIIPGAESQTYSATMSGDYWVRVNTSGCSIFSAPVSVTVFPLPNAGISGAGYLCEGSSLVLTASPAGSYLWNTGQTTQSITVSTSGSYRVAVTDANGCTAQSPPTQIDQTPLPRIDSYTTTSPGTCGTNTGTITLNGLLNGYLNLQLKRNGILYLTGASYPTAPGSLVITNLPAGTYSAQVSVNSCSSNIMSGIVVADPPLPTPVITGTSAVCQGGTIAMEATNVSPAYSWSGPNGFTSSQRGFSLPNAQPVQSGVYTVTAIGNAGCTSSASFTVTVNPSPTITIASSGPSTFCTGGSVTLTATSSEGTYNWSNGATEPSITVSASGNYLVSTTNSAGCSGSASQLVTVVPMPVVNPTNTGPYCEGNTISLNGNASNATIFSWSGPNGFSSNVASPTRLNSVNADGGVYTFTASNSQCTATGTTTVVVNGHKPSFLYSGNQGFTAAAVSPAVGGPATTYRFEILYTDADGNLPQPGFPRMHLDFEGNGVLTNPNDLSLLMYPLDASDNDVTDGKIYYAQLAGMQLSSNWKIYFYAKDVTGCEEMRGPFAGPAVKTAPNLTIFANDISFSNIHPDPGTQITVSAVIRNSTSQPAQNFSVKLINQAFPSTLYPVITVPSLGGNSNTTISWAITTPNVDAWCPMQVVIDYNNDIDETNEYDNQAIRPFVNGDFALAGGIKITAYPSPSVLCPSPNSYLNVYGSAIYYNTAVPLADPSVAGATVTVRVPQTGQTFTGYTNSNGHYNIPVQAPITTGIYSLEVSITDYTIDGDTTSSFTILPPCIIQQVTGPDLVSSISLNTSEIFVGGSVSGSVTVTNVGTLAANPSTMSFTSSEGVPAGIQYQPNASLAIGASQTLPFSPLTFNNPGYVSVSAMADATYQVNELHEGNNQSYRTIRVCPTTPDLSPQYWGYLQVWRCNSFTFAVANNTCLPVNTPFDLRLEVMQGATIVATYNRTITNVVPRDGYIYVTYNDIFPAAGSYQLKLTADAPGLVNEYNELNNVLTITVQSMDCKPELTVTSCNAVTPTDPQAGGPVTINAIVSNSGNAPAIAPFVVDFSLNGVHYPVTVNTNIPGGGSVNVSGTITAPAHGCNVVSIHADYGNTVEEMYENNNTASTPMSWDFYPGSFCGSNMFWNYTYNIGQPVNMSVGLYNAGAYRASEVKTRFEVSGPGITGWLDLGYASNANVAQTCGCPYAAVLPTPFVFFQAGVYQVRMTVDAVGNYTECNESNNVLVVPVTVINIPDYRILSQHIAPSLLNPAIGQPINISVSYQNLGASNTLTPISLKVKVDEQDLQTLSAPGLLTGTTNTIPFTTTWSSFLPGLHVIRAIADAGNAVNESNELNNEATRVVIVGETANLKFMQFDPSSTSPSLNDAISIDINIANTGPVQCSGDLVLYYLDDQNNRVQFAQRSITVNGNGSLPLSVPWNVADVSTTIIGVIQNTDIPESNTNDNEASADINAVSVTAIAQAACPGLDNGEAIATVTGGVGPYTYMWSNNATTATMNAPAGTYTVTVKDSKNATATATVTIPEAAVAVPTITAGGDITFCHGGSVTLTSSLASNYTWSTGATSQSIVVTESGDYTVSSTGERGCVGTSAIVSVTVKPLPVVTVASSGPAVICPGQSVTLTASGGMAYTWSTGSNSNVITVSQTGSYEVVGSTDGCSSAPVSTSLTVVDLLPPVPTVASLPTITEQCLATVAAPTATDDCAGTITGTTTDPTTYTTQGSFTITWKYDDGNGNVSTQTQTVIIDDVTPPVISCPFNITVNAAAGQCGAVVNYSAPSATDNCGTGTLPTTLAGHTYKGTFGGHTYFISNSATTPETAHANAIAAGGHLVTISSEAENAFVSAMNPGFIWIGHTDRASEGTWKWVTSEPVTFTKWNAGEPNNFQGNEDWAVINWGPNGTWNDWFYTSNALYVIEFEGGNIPTSLVSGLGSGSMFPVGTTTETWKAVDAGGNEVTCSFTVTVVDNQDPTIVAPAAVTVNTDPGGCTTDRANVSLGTPVVHDNCPGVTYSNNAPAVFQKGTTTVTWTATDAAGRMKSATQSVIVVDNENPILLGVPADVSVLCTNVPEPATVSASDNCAGLSMVSLAEVRTDGPCVGSYLLTRKWSVTDASGNVTEATQVVSVFDNVAPSLTIPADVSVQCDAIPALGSPTASDNCGNATITFVGETRVNGNCSGNYQLKRTWTATDDCGNSVTKTQTITVNDNTAPVFTRPADVTIYTNTNCVYDASVSQTGDVTNESDNCSSGIQATYSDAVTAGSCPGTYIISRTWSLTDDCGNTAASQVQTITVSDNIPPTVTYNVNAVFHCFDPQSNYAVSPLTASDNCSSALTYKYVVYAQNGDRIRTGATANSSGVFNVGVNTIQWKVSDGCGNETAATTYVTVNPQISGSVNSFSVLPKGVRPNTIYLGYAPASSAVLTATPAGGTAPYTYSWSSSLPGSFSQVPGDPSSVRVTAVSGGIFSYTVTITDAKGCVVVLTKLVTVTDVRCGNKMDKVLVCHNTSSVKNPWVQICIAPPAVATHLENGSYLGTCETTQAITRSTKPGPGQISQVVVAYPNPNIGQFSLELTGFSDGKVRILIVDALGRTVDQKELLVKGGSEVVSFNLLKPASGIYQARVESKHRTLTTQVIIAR